MTNGDAIIVPINDCSINNYRITLRRYHNSREAYKSDLLRLPAAVVCLIAFLSKCIYGACYVPIVGFRDTLYAFFQRSRHTDRSGILPLA